MFYIELPYVVFKSGGIIELSERVDIDLKYKQNGNLNMSYVTSMRGTPAILLLSLIIPDWDITPLSEISDKNDYDESLKIGKEYLDEGIDNAIIVAFRESDYDIEITNETIRVIYILKSADTNIQIGDEIKEINGVEVGTFESIRENINKLHENNQIKLTVINNGKEYERYAKVYKDKDNSLKIGVAFHNHHEYITEIPVKIKMKDNESGSSGGLMMALQIYNILTNEDITKGLNIVGTGSIKIDGTVEEIGGVKYKVLAAEKNNADIFFCPEKNYKEAMEVKKRRNLKLNIVKVNTFDDAKEYLENFN